MGALKIVLMGAYPPPIGGISVHVARLAMHLRQRSSVLVIDPYVSEHACAPSWVKAVGPPGVPALMRLCVEARRQDPDIVHIHVSAMRRFVWGAWFVGVSMPEDAVRILTVHSGRFLRDYRTGGRLFRWALKRLLRRFDGIIAVNVEIADAIMATGISAERVAVVPAFLPPAAKISGPVLQVVESIRESYPKVLCASGHALPEYGFHLLLDAISTSRELSTTCALVICLYGQADLEYLSELERRAGCSAGIVIFRDLEAEVFSGLLAKVDIFVRPTSVDGDSVALREAAFYGRQVVASDAAPRPPGALLYSFNDVPALQAAVTEAVLDPRAGLITGKAKSGAELIEEFVTQMATGRRPERR